MSDVLYFFYVERGYTESYERKVCRILFFVGIYFELLVAISCAISEKINFMKTRTNLF